MGVFPSGQWGQTVNLLLSASVVRIHPRPPRTPVSNGYRSFCFICLEKGDARVDSNSIDPPNSPAGKKPLCNSDDRCQRQKQGGAVGAAASRMRVPPKARCSRWEPRPGLLFCAVRVIHPRPPKTATYQNTLRFCFTMLFPAVSASPSHQSSCARMLFCTISPAGVRARVWPSKVAYPARTQFCTKASCAVENCLPYRAL